MGGNSSKKKITPSSQGRGSNATITTITTINTVDGEIMLNEDKHYNKKGNKNKKESKDKVKIKVKDESGGKKKQKNSKYRGGCKDHMRISFEENTLLAGGGDLGHERRDRKKSACPSCDAREMLMGQIRSRSGSLRYSDFNKIVRQSRIEDDEEAPLEVFLDGVPEPIADTVCFICGVYTGSVTRTCRVCCHVYHNGCLHKIGHAMDSHALELAQMDLWSCHQCSDISRLLSREETQYAFNCLEGLKIDPDAVTVKDYLAYKQKMCETLGKPVTQEKTLDWIGRFNHVIRDVSGGEKTLDWSQFLQAETICILRIRCKESLVKLMTEMEFSAARKMYKNMMGPSGSNATMAQVKQRILLLYTNFGIQVWPEDKEEVSALDEEDFERKVTWSEFLRILAIHMLTVRENNPTIPIQNNEDLFQGNNINNTSDATSPSSDSLDDEEYRTCDSELDSPSTPTPDPAPTTTDNYGTLSKPGHKKNLSDFELLNISGDDANKSISILDDLQKAFNLTGSTTESSYQNPSGASLSLNDSNELKSSITENNHSHAITDPCAAQEAVEKKTAPRTSETPGIESSPKSSPKARHWHDDPKFKNTVDVPVTVSVTVTKETVPARKGEEQHGTQRTTLSATLERSPLLVNKRRSEVLVRPSTEEGRSPRRALSQKLVAPAYGLVDKIQNQEWNC